MKKILTAILLLGFVLILFQAAHRKETRLDNYSIYHDDEFGGAYIEISAEDFNKLGFKYGDSVDVVFSTNNAIWKDVGYYNGYYVPAGQELLVAYPGYKHIKFCINYGDDIYANNGFDENTKVTISLNEAAKYKDIQDTLSISYSDDITKYPSKEVFANFRMMYCGDLKSNILYRGASPVDNSRSRAVTVDALLKENGIRYDIDLADKNTDAPKYQVYEYFEELTNANKVVFLGMGAAYKSEEFSSKMKILFESILENDGPYYIHCLEGKDRTGFVCMVIEALCGATYDELIDDYFVTYKNYYGIEKGSTKYEAIKKLHIDEMISYVRGFGDCPEDISTSAASYLVLNVGLTQEQVEKIVNKLSR